MTTSFSRLLMGASMLLVIACDDSTADNTATEANQRDSSSFNLSSARTAIDAENAKFMEAIKKGDSVALAGLYSQDALIMPSNTEAVPKAGMTGLWGYMIRSGVKDIKLTTQDLVGNEEMLSETGRFEIFADGQKLVDKGKYIVVWRPVDGTWKMYRDIFNSDLPPASAK